MGVGYGECPYCGYYQYCGCEACIETVPEGYKPIKHIGNDILQCQNCGLEMHIDWWVYFCEEQFEEKLIAIKGIPTNLTKDALSNLEYAIPLDYMVEEYEPMWYVDDPDFQQRYLPWYAVDLLKKDFDERLVDVIFQ